METRGPLGGLRGGVALQLLVASVMTLSSVGCTDICEENAEACGQPGVGGSAGVSTNTGTTSPSTTGGGEGGASSTSTSQGGSGASGQGGDGGSGGGGSDPGCAPAEGDVLADGCGIHVDASAPEGGDGTKTAPARSLAEALALADGAATRVYVCDGNVDGGVMLPGGTSILGGYTCDWIRSSASRPTVTAEVGGEGGPAAALVVSGAGATRIEDVNVVATLAPDTPGASVVGILAVDADLHVVRVDVEAEGGAAGASGDTPSGGSLNGDTGTNGADGCMSAASVDGGPGDVNVCGGGSQSVGGTGGDGTNLGGSLSDGTSGVADPTTPSPAANAGTGEPAAGNCTNGDDGAPGGAGDPALPAATLGTLTASGYSGIAGNAGQSTGTPGQGGGGGGGARGIDHCSPTTNAGPSGGGGGSGGCGGAPGAGGRAGGASIGIAALRTTLSLDDVAITTGDGGDGGDGSPGQQGGMGGSGGVPSQGGACSGGQGGRGGWGGAGGGGLGGPSIAIALSEAPSDPALSGVTYEVGAAGDGGTGGDGSDDALNGNSASNVGPDGAAGARCAVLRFGVDREEACEVEPS